MEAVGPERRGGLSQAGRPVTASASSTDTYAYSHSETVDAATITAANSDTDWDGCTTTTAAATGRAGHSPADAVPDDGAVLPDSDSGLATRRHVGAGATAAVSSADSAADSAADPAAVRSAEYAGCCPRRAAGCRRTC
ncbi:hypothetical protein EV646_11744 [Kribbella antiqua]|uniref:Uncharacterized protein n=1 Tax=Kribbella antiqua TaxID=2512217 RepID=A0A4R2I827_9ACTN|nr:hypothetical protein EV646_11744 [Kribbella antiqua]